MERMTIEVVELDGNLALVKARSAKLVNGRPEAEITVRLELPTIATKQLARDLALRYLDPVDKI
jgi:hypothetical protein